MKHDVHKIFDRLCEEIYFGMNFKLILMDMEFDQLEELCAFINKCRLGRKQEVLNWTELAMRPSLRISWEEWNSGGGCMIWSHEFCDGTSIHVTDECLVLSKYNIEKHREAEFNESRDLEEVDYVQLVHYFEDPAFPTSDEPLSFYLCPFLGQEMADLVAADINEILRCW